MKSRWLLTGIILMFGTLFFFIVLSRLEPRILPKKAGESKKTGNVSSQKKCLDTYTAHINNDGSITVPILLYHYVENVKDVKDIYRTKMNVHPLVFEEHIKTILQDGYTPVFMKEIPNLIRGKSNICYPAIVLTFDDGYADFYTDVFPLLKKYKIKATAYVIANYIGRNDFLNEAQVKELIASNLVEIGSHTIDHPELTILTEKEVRNQTTESKQVLESMFPVPIVSFSYPLGRYNNATESIVAESHYISAVTVRSGTTHTNLDMFRLSRIRPEVFFYERETQRKTTQ